MNPDESRDFFFESILRSYRYVINELEKSFALKIYSFRNKNGIVGWIFLRLIGGGLVLLA